MKNKGFSLAAWQFVIPTQNKRFVPKTNVSETNVFAKTNKLKLVEKMFVFGGSKLVPTEFVLSFQFQTKVSNKGWFRTLKLTFSHEKH